MIIGSVLYVWMKVTYNLIYLIVQLYLEDKVGVNHMYSVTSEHNMQSYMYTKVELINIV